MTGRNVAVAAVLGAALILTGAVATNHAAVRDAAVATEVPNVKGDLRVTLQVIDTEGKVRTDTEDGCTQVDFHPEYFVLRLKNGGGRVVPLRQVTGIHWQGR